MKEWIPFPRYIFRKEIAISLIKKKLAKRSYFLEIGCASGDFGITLAKMGYNGIMIDFSDDAFDYIDRNLKEKKIKNLEFRKIELTKFKNDKKFDLVIMFEVLEHIKDDKKTIKKINSLLEKNGFFLISVPSKKELWGANDDLAGHVKRYEKKELRNLLESEGFKIINLYSYGYPCLNLLKYFRDKVAEKKLKELKEKNKIFLTKKSGLNALKINFPFLNLFFNKYFLYLPIKICNLFNNMDLAEGYLCLAKKIK
jgi:2-polyprenyl-3-methyl-5-hydroxy-6-metoxy-1,4-benzoquinol methylase